MKKYGLPKKSAKRYCDELWSMVVKARDGFRCIICNKTEFLNAHHLISRKVQAYRYNTSNGVCLCSGCHNFNLYHSPAHAPWKFEEWIKTNRPTQYSEWIKNRENLQIGQFVVDYENIYPILEKEYSELIGKPHRKEITRRNQLVKAEAEICKLALENKSQASIAKIFGTSKKHIGEVIKRNGIEIKIGRKRNSEYKK